MIKFLLKTLLMLLLILASYALIYLLPAEHVGYLSASVGKLNRLKSTPPPRVIFIGGSNVAFGLDSQLVEQRLGRPVVNMGLGAGQGLRFMLDQVKPYIGSGDLVVVVPEYEQFSTELNGERDLADLVVMSPENIRYVSSPQQYLVILKSLPLPFQDKIFRRLVTVLHGVPPSSDIYRADGFNRYGDLTTHLGRAPRTEWLKDIQPGAFKPTITVEAVNVLNGFQNYAESRGTRVALVFPCLADQLNTEERHYLDTIYQRLKSDTRLKIIAPPENYIYPLGCFFDSRYHLVEQCRETRTRQILIDLNQAQLTENTGKQD